MARLQIVAVDLASAPLTCLSFSKSQFFYFVMAVFSRIMQRVTVQTVLMAA